MSHVVRAHNVLDTDKPPAYSAIDHAEVIIKDRELHSDKPEVIYEVGSPRPRVSATDDTLPVSHPSSPA